MPSMHLENSVAIVNLGEGENRFSLSWMQQFNRTLDELETSNVTALVTTGSGKFYSNGLDVAEAEGPVELEPDYVHLVHQLLRRILCLPLPTVAALNGHAFGAGALLAMAHDYRTMRSERGFFCFPEVNIGIPFTLGMASMVQSKLTPAQARDAMLTGRRSTAEQAFDGGLVDLVVPKEQLLQASADLATAHLPAHPQTLGTVKSTLYAKALTDLELPHIPAKLGR